MARKIKNINDLYEETLNNITSNANEWFSFLNCAAMNYKYSFSDQVLIYAQKPEAIACAEIEVWNKGMKRWVNKGAKGIALVTEINGYTVLRYVFDVSDTNSKTGKKFTLWNVSKLYEEEIIETLENEYGDLENKSSLSNAIISVSKNIVEDNYQDYLEDLKNNYNDSLFSKQDNIEELYKKILSNSIACMVMKRCGINTEDYFKSSDFDSILNFNTYETVTRFGIATSDISEMCIREIYSTIKKVRISEIEKIRTFDISKEKEYDRANSRETAKRRYEDEYNNLYNAGGLSDTRSSITSEEENRGNWQIRFNETRLSEEEQQSSIHNIVDERPVNGTSIRNTGRIRDESERTSITDDGRRENYRRIETTESNEVDRANEQLEDDSRRNSDQRANLQLETFNKDSRNCPYVVTDDKINQILSIASLKNTNEEIKEYFNLEKNITKRAEYLKGAFDSEEVNVLILNQLYGYRAFDNGLLIWKGDFNLRNTESFVEWKELTYHYDSMILLHQLYDRKQKLPTEKAQLSLLELDENQERPELEFSQEFIDKFLQERHSETKFNIYRQFQSSFSKNDNIKFLKELYGIGGASHTIKGSGIGYETNSKGITLNRGYLDNKIEKLLGWNVIEKRLTELIKLDRYLNLKEKEDYPKWLEEQESVQEKDENVLNEEESEEYVEEYEYQLGDKVYIGVDEYEIISLEDDIVRLYDYQYPLFNQEFSRNEFESKIKDNPANEHLKVRRLTEEHISHNEYGEFNDEVDLIEHILHNYKIFDIKVNFNSNEEIVAYDEDNEWVGKELYDFLFNQLFEYNDDETVKFIDKYDVERLKEYQKKYETIEKEKEAIDDLIGEHLTIDNRKFIVDSINDNKVSLKDITFNGTIGFPIFREESIDYVKDLLAKKEKDELIPAFEKRKKERVTTFDLHPEIKNEDRHNFHIIDDNLGVGTDKEKFNRNIEAIKVLKQCEKENRFATVEEQKVLAQYTGWGGLPQAFDERNDSWHKEYLELKNILDEEEYKSAMTSVLTSFYTPPIVIRKMYKTLENIGIKRANILEPSCGTGNFMGMLPDTLKDSKMYGIELDEISGKIAQQLYQKNSIAIKGYEEVTLPDSFFDVVIGNVPFDNFKISDKRYDKNNFLVHDYFFAKSIDKLRPGGILAFITSKGTLDKENPNVRKYIAQRADLLGAIRLPNNTFIKNAGTKITTDIIFLQKRDSITDIEPDWVYLTTDSNGIKMNSYFVDNPNMVCGNMKIVPTQYGPKSTCEAKSNISLEEQLDKAIKNIQAEIKEYEFDDVEETEIDLSIPADFNVRNFSYTVVDNKIYYRENSRMYPQELPLTTQNRIKGLIEIRDCTRTLIELQTENYSDYEIKEEQDKLNNLYDKFTKKYGLINSRANASAFSNDSSFYLLCSLEILDENKELKSKADMFFKRTINPNREITKVDTAQEALVISLSEKAKVDFDYMKELTSLESEKIIEELKGQIFKVPSFDEEEIWVTADEYLSGDIREKLKVAKKFAETDSSFEINVKYLKDSLPKELDASEISVRLGATWIPTEIIEEFMWELLEPSWYVRDRIKVHYMEGIGQWNIENKSVDRGNVKVNSTYGTHRINAYKIIETTLNLRDVKVYDYKVDSDGNKKQELNKKETAIALAKQEQIKNAFVDWIWSDIDRREKLCKIYNEKFNSIRPREYDGSHIKFVGMNPEIKLRKHQVNGVARILYGGNTLLAHEVGAGKTYTMVAAAMESKRLGLCNKSMFVVPNHIVEQFASEFLQLYPSANILVTTKKDFSTANRKTFCSRIATGDYDAVIISHSQFEKIPMSYERQKELLERQRDDVVKSIANLREDRGENMTIKMLLRLQRKVEAKLKKLNDTSRKDNVVTFEELGIDRLFVDEAHYYKNLYVFTKMKNVGGISQTEAQKSSDLFMKCRYLDELTGGRGIIFATGTPVSNSMAELYTMQRYLQYAELEKRNLQTFDAWASTFGETVTAIELAPEGTGYRAKTRFAKFYNLPELMAMFKEVADIQTADMLNLPVPKANYKNIVVKPTEMQKKIVESLGERAEAVRNNQVRPDIDNMLKITNDGRKVALDQRLYDDKLPDDENNKISVCANNIYKIWKEYKDKRLTQLVFCDLSTPKNDGTFNAYDELKRKLELNGIPDDEVQFIHYANTDIRKKELFSKVRKGIVRALMGSTSKMGAGTNCQDKLIALHDLDCPWRPSDLQQRAGRIVRQGNENEEVYIYRYVTEGTFDAYLYQLLENKQRFISQVFTSKTPVRQAEDIDETALSYAEIKALAAGNPLIIEKTELDTEVAKLKVLKQSYQSQKYALENKIAKYYPIEIKNNESRIKKLEADLDILKSNSTSEKFLGITINNSKINDKKIAGAKILELCKKINDAKEQYIGEYKQFKMSLAYDTLFKKFKIILKNNLSYETTLGDDELGNITRIDNLLSRIEEDLESTKNDLEETIKQYNIAKEEVKKPFEQEDELKTKTKRLNELNVILNINNKDKSKEIIDFDDDMDNNINISKNTREFAR